MAVRNESVRLTLEDAGFTTKMAKAAAATAATSKALHDLDGTNVRTTQSTRTVGDEMDVFTKKTSSGRAEIDRFSGRLSLLRDVAITLGPSLAPIGAATVPMIAGLAAQLGAAAGAAGVAALAFNGIGDALGALNDYQLEPTEKNLAKLEQAMTQIGPAGADFVTFLDSIGPQLSAIQDTARAGLLPGVQEGLESLLTMGPRVQDIVANIAAAMGEMAARTGDALSGPRFAEFFAYIENTAGPALMEMGRTIGFVTEGLANMMVAFAPASADFTGGLEDMTRRFAEWSRGLEDNQSFQNFLDYVRESGPQVIDLIGGLINALVGLMQAAAPIGTVVVQALTQVADAFAAIAASPIGTPILAAAAAFVALNRAVQVGTALYGTAAKGLTGLGVAAGSAGASLTTMQKSLGLAAVALGGFLAVDAIQSDFDGLSTSSQQLTADLLNLVEQGAGARLSGEFSDLAGSLDLLTDPNAAQRLQTWLADVSTIESFDSDAMNKASEQFEALDAALTGLVSSGGPETAAAAFDALASSLGLTAPEVEALKEQLPGYTDALQGAENAARLAADSTDSLANAEAAQARATQEAIAALREKRDQLLAAFDAETAYRQAMVDAREQAKKNTAGIKGNSEEVLANRSALSQLAAAWNGQSKEVKNNTDRYKEARAEFIRNAEGMGVLHDRAVELADEFLAMPKRVETKLVLKAEERAARAAIKATEADLANLHRRKTEPKIDADNKPARDKTNAVKGDLTDLDNTTARPRVDADTASALSALGAVQSALARIVSKTVTVTVNKVGSGLSGLNFDTGGYTGPGHRLEPAGIVHRGEVVIPQDVVRRDKSHLASRYGFLPGMSNLPGYADGGLVSGRGGVGAPVAATARDIDALGRAAGSSARGMIAETRARGRMLERQSEAVKKELDASKAKLDALKAERDAIKASVDQRLRSDAFAPQDPGDFMSIGRPDNWAELTPEQQKAHLDAEWAVNQSLGYGQVQSPEDIIRADIAEAREMEKVLKQLKRKGLSDNVIGDLLSQGGIEMLRAYAEGTRGDIATLNKLVERRDRVLSSASEAGGAFLRDDIREQVREVRGLRKDSQEINQAIKDNGKRLDRLEELAKKAPKETGSEVGKAVNGAAAAGQRRRS